VLLTSICFKHLDKLATCVLAVLACKAHHCAPVLHCSAIFDGYLDDLLTFDELLMPMDAGFDGGARPDSRGGAGPSTGGHLGGTLGEDLGGFCSNCWCACLLLRLPSFPLLAPQPPCHVCCSPLQGLHPGCCPPSGLLRIL
jgi:hypothetical protein